MSFADVDGFYRISTPHLVVDHVFLDQNDDTVSISWGRTGVTHFGTKKRGRLQLGDPAIMAILGCTLGTLGFLGFLGALLAVHFHVIGILSHFGGFRRILSRATGTIPGKIHVHSSMAPIGKRTKYEKTRVRFQVWEV